MPKLVTLTLALVACSQTEPAPPDAQALAPYICAFSSTCPADESSTAETWDLCEPDAAAAEAYKGAWLDRCVQGTLCGGKPLLATCSGVCFQAEGSAVFACTVPGPIGD